MDYGICGIFLLKLNDLYSITVSNIFEAEYNAIGYYYEINNGEELVIVCSVFNIFHHSRHCMVPFGTLLCEVLAAAFVQRCCFYPLVMNKSEKNGKKALDTFKTVCFRCSGGQVDYSDLIWGRVSRNTGYGYINNLVSLTIHKKNRLVDHYRLLNSGMIIIINQYMAAHKLVIELGNSDPYQSRVAEKELITIAAAFLEQYFNNEQFRAHVYSIPNIERLYQQIESGYLFIGSGISTNYNSIKVIRDKTVETNYDKSLLPSVRQLGHSLKSLITDDQINIRDIISSYNSLAKNLGIEPLTLPAPIMKTVAIYSEQPRSEVWQQIVFSRNEPEKLELLSKDQLLSLYIYLINSGTTDGDFIKKVKNILLTKV